MMALYLFSIHLSWLHMFLSWLSLLATGIGNRNAYNSVYFDDSNLAGHRSFSRLIYVDIHSSIPVPSGGHRYGESTQKLCSWLVAT